MAMATATLLFKQTIVILFPAPLKYCVINVQLR